MPDPSILKRGASWKIRVVLLLPNHLQYFGGQNDIDRGLCTYVGVMKLSNFGAFGPYFLVFFSRIMVALIRRAKGALFEYQRGRTWGNFNLKGGVGEAHVMQPQTLTNHQFPPCLLLFANICEFTIKYVHTSTFSMTELGMPIDHNRRWEQRPQIEQRRIFLPSWLEFFHVFNFWWISLN